MPIMAKGLSMLTKVHVEYLSNYGIDYLDAMDRFAGNESLYFRLASKFVNDENMSALKDALSLRDVNKAIASAHALKGVSGNLSFKELYSVMCEMTELLRAENIAAAEVLLPHAQKAYDKVIDFITVLSHELH